MITLILLDGETSATANSSHNKEIETLRTVQLPTLLEQLPYDHSHHADFSQVGDKWLFRFQLNSPRARFSAGGHGDSPTEAFLVAKQVIHRQIREWHEARSKNKTYDSTTNTEDVYA